MSSPPQHSNAATPRSRTKFARLRQQLEHFRHRIAEDYPRRPTSAGLKIDEIVSGGYVRHDRPNGKS
jgi:hypothetical protein